MFSVTCRESKRYLTYICNDDTNPEVLHILRSYFELSSRKIKSVKFAEDGLLVNGIRVNVREHLHRGDILQALLDDVMPSCECLLDYELSLNILYEDEDFIFIEKPSGWVCHPSQGHYADSLANAVCAVLRLRGEASSLHLLGRLDKDTSGIVGFAKNSVMQDKMEQQRENEVYYKEYIALIHGCPEKLTGRLTTSLAETATPDGKHTYMVKAEAGEGKTADTAYEVILPGKEISLCRVHIKTGRTHQIRFHMSNLGYPLVGDERYGGRYIYGIERAALHAARVVFKHPITDELINLECEMPADMKNIISLIEK